MSGEISKVGVVGLGTMGAGIVEVFARNGFDVVGLDMSDVAVERGRGHIEKSTDRAVSRGKLTAEERNEVIGRIRLTQDYADLSDRELVIEAVPENLDLKREIFATLDSIVPASAILASNTSSLSVTDLSLIHI